MNIEEKEAIEIDFWKNSIEENPNKYSVPNLINKFKEADIFLDKLSKYNDIIEKSSLILELGGGQGWASCMLKHYYPKKEVYTSDISPYAIESVSNWENIFRVKLDKKFACKSYEIPLESKSVDLIFCFAAAHHFIKHRKTLIELNRVLKPNGKVLYLHEPVCLSYIYSLAKKRVNKKRHVVPEDLLKYKKLKKLAKEHGMKMEVHFSPTTKNRSPFGTIYYSLIRKLVFMQNILPCTADLFFTKEMDV